jgi:histidinol-phosphate aminotransferase
MSFWSELLRPEFIEFKPYKPVHGNFRVRLDANEAPPMASALASERLAREFSSIALERYPDAGSDALRAAIARHLGRKDEEILIGVGSDEVIGMLVTALSRARSSSEPPTVLTTTPSFVMYKMSARLRGQRVIEVPLDANWEPDAAGLSRALEVASPHVVFLANPNNPTGTVASEAVLRRVIEAAPRSLVVVDEAYVDYANENRLHLIDEYENVAVLRTLSKVGFAGLRVGWLVGRGAFVAELDKVRQPYNMSSVAQRLATVVLNELWGEVETVTRSVKAERARLSAALGSMPGLSVTPSQANFLWLGSEMPAEKLFQALAERGVLVRSFHERGGRLANRLRVTVGTPAENDELLECFRSIL